MTYSDIKLENHKKKIYEYDEFYYCVNDSGDDYIHIRREVDIPKSWEYIDFIGDYQTNVEKKLIVNYEFIDPYNLLPLLSISINFNTGI